MAWIDTVSPEDADGPLRKLYEAARGRAGKVYRIIQLMSPNPSVLRASMGLYLTTMFGPSGLTRSQREMLATVVSRTNGCAYWTRAHAEDLRDEVREEGRDPAFADAIASDWRMAPFDHETAETDRALCSFAEKLTREPGSMAEEDVEGLRSVGLTDRDVHDATQVVAYFGYINRVADALGVDPEPEWDSEPT